MDHKQRIFFGIINRYINMMPRMTCIAAISLFLVLFFFFYLSMDLYFIYLHVVLRIKPSAFHMLGKCSTTKPQPHPP
ncbi:hypothetical protein V4Y02_23570, partial [Escherichia coli]